MNNYWFLKFSPNSRVFQNFRRIILAFFLLVFSYGLMGVSWRFSSKNLWVSYFWGIWFVNSRICLVCEMISRYVVFWVLVFVFWVTVHLRLISRKTSGYSSFSFKIDGLKKNGFEMLESRYHWSHHLDSFQKFDVKSIIDGCSYCWWWLIVILGGC